MIKAIILALVMLTSFDYAVAHIKKGASSAQKKIAQQMRPQAEQPKKQPSHENVNTDFIATITQQLEALAESNFSLIEKLFNAYALASQVISQTIEPSDLQQLSEEDQQKQLAYATSQQFGQFAYFIISKDQGIATFSSTELENQNEITKELLTNIIQAANKPLELRIHAAIILCEEIKPAKSEVPEHIFKSMIFGQMLTNIIFSTAEGQALIQQIQQQMEKVN